jgi:hypothetical protein
MAAMKVTMKAETKVQMMAQKKDYKTVKPMEKS